MTRIIKNQPILRPEYLGTLATSREVIDAAERAAEGIREQAGRRGREDGMALAAAALAEARLRRDRWLDEARVDLATLSLTVASSLCMRACEQDPTILEELCRKAIEQVSRAGRIAVHVSPRDADALEGLARDGAPIEIVPDGSITPGGCIVESDLGSVDARLETRTEALRAALEAVVERYAKKDA